MTIAYLNGDYLPLQEARVSAMDRGFLFGDGVYEVIPVYNGRLFRLEQHLERLALSLNSIKLVIDAKTLHDIPSMLSELVKKNHNGNKTVYIQITRGADTERKFTFPESPRPTLFAYCSPLVTKSIEEMSQGITTITLPDIRWHNCSTKAITLLANVLARQEAKQQGAEEAILVRDGAPIEASSSNLFIVQNQTLITPPLTPEILGGVTRQLVLELAQQHHVDAQIRGISKEELMNADEVWLTGTSREISPVIRIDDKTIGGGKPGPLWYRMIQYYQNFKNTLNA